MRTTSIKTIYLTRKEIKAAIIHYLAAYKERQLAQHLAKNECEMAWSQEGDEFIVSIDGEIQDSKKKKAAGYIPPY